MENIVKFYPFYCEKCGRKIKNKSKMRNLCTWCYNKKIKNENMQLKRQIRNKK